MCTLCEHLEPLQKVFAGIDFLFVISASRATAASFSLEGVPDDGSFFTIVSNA